MVIIILLLLPLNKGEEIYNVKSQLFYTTIYINTATFLITFAILVQRKEVWNIKCRLPVGNEEVQDIIIILPKDINLHSLYTVIYIKIVILSVSLSLLRRGLGPKLKGGKH